MKKTMVVLLSGAMLTVGTLAITPDAEAGQRGYDLGRKTADTVRQAQNWTNDRKQDANRAYRNAKDECRDFKRAYNNYKPKKYR
jgi:hypothetical protein